MSGTGGGPAGAGGARTGGVGVAGMAAQPGTGGSAGAPGVVQFRAGSFRSALWSLSAPDRQSVSVAVAPSIQGQDGLLLAHIVLDKTATSDAESLGFQLVTTVIGATAPTALLRVYWKLAAGPVGQTTTEPADLRVTNSKDGYQVLFLFAVHGADSVAPILASTTASGVTGEMTVPGISVARPRSLGLWWKAGYGSGTDRTPDGWTIVVRGQDGVNDIAWRPLEIGPTGDLASTQRSASPWVNVFAVIQPPP